MEEINFKEAIVKTFAGNGRNSVKDGPVGNSSFSFPKRLCVVPSTNSLIVADQLNSGVRICNENSLDTFKFQTKQQIPISSIIIPQNNHQIAYFTDQVHAKIRRLNLQNSEVSTLSGSAVGHRDGNIQLAKYNQPTGIASACNGRILVVCDTGNNVLRCIDFENGDVSTLCGIVGVSGSIPVDLQVSLKKVKFNKIVCVIVSVYYSGVLYVVDQGNHCIVQIDTLNETAKVIFGIPGSQGKIQVNGQQLLNNPKSICELPDGNLLICDSGNNCLRYLNLVTGNHLILNSHTRPHNYQDQFLAQQIKQSNRYKKGWVDGPINQSLFNDPSDVQFNGKNIFIADQGNHLVRIIEIDDLATQKFSCKRQERISNALESSGANFTRCVPKIFCRKCELECVLFNGKYCDRCGSDDIFAVKLPETLDLAQTKNPVRLDYLDKVYFKGDQAAENYQYPIASNTLTVIQPEQSTLEDQHYEQLQNDNHQGSFVSKLNFMNEFSDIKQPEMSQPLQNFKSKVITSNNKNAQQLISQVERNYEKFQELEKTRQVMVENGGKMPSKSVELQSDDIFVSLVETEEFGDFLFPTTYKLDLKQLQQTVYDFNIDENQYMQDLAECPQHDGFDSLNQMKTNMPIDSLEEYLNHLKLIEPISLAVFSYEGDVFFPVPLSVNKSENFTSFVDTEATTVNFCLFSDIQVKEFFISLNTIQNRDLFSENQLPDILPFVTENCSELISHFCSCKLSDLLKLSKQSEMNNYQVVMNYILEDGNQVEFYVIFGCGTPKGIECDNLKLMGQLNQIQFVRRNQ